MSAAQYGHHRCKHDASHSSRQESDSDNPNRHDRTWRPCGAGLVDIEGSRAWNLSGTCAVVSCRPDCTVTGEGNAAGGRFYGRDAANPRHPPAPARPHSSGILPKWQRPNGACPTLWASVRFHNKHTATRDFGPRQLRKPPQYDPAIRNPSRAAWIQRTQGSHTVGGGPG
jgi:hypothetical protein